MSGFKIFTLAGIPVSVSFFYLLLMGYYAFRLGSAVEIIVWITTLTLSLLVHEFGHGLVARHYKLSPQILLHGFGGLCAHQRASRDLHDVAIICAGPGLGIAFSLLVWGLEVAINLAAPGFIASRPPLTLAFQYVWWISFVWNFVNLIPLYPLDGGQLFRLGAIRLLGPLNGERATHGLGILIGAVGVAVALSMSSTLLAILCAFAIWENASPLISGRSSGPIRRTNPFAGELFTKAQAAMEEGRWRDAARYGHQLRAENNVPDTLLGRTWELLTVATANQGEHEEALSYARRAPQTPMIAETEVRCLAALGRAREARQLLAEGPASKLPERTRSALEALIATPRS